MQIGIQKKSVTVLTLELSDKEVSILIGMMQNSIDDETEEVSNLRESIFNTLRPTVVKRQLDDSIHPNRQ